MILAIVAKGTIILSAGLAGAWLARGSRAAVRHAVLAASLAVLLGLPIVSMVVPPVLVEVPMAPTVLVDTVEAAPQVVSSNVPAAVSSARSQWSLPSMTNLLLAGWLCGVVFFLVRMIVGLRQVRALVHELEHVRRRDWVSHCVARIACAVYWFHPLIWMARHRLTLEAERACDDAVLSGSEATLYADQLVGLARRLSGDRKSPALAMANRSDLSARVGAVLDSGQRRGRAGKVLVVSAGAAAAAMLVTMSPLRIAAAPQMAAAHVPAFEVASVKPYAPSGPPYEGCNSHDDSGMLKRTGCTLQQLVQQAYSVKAYQVGVKAPAWVSLDRFVVQARPTAPATPAEMKVMLQPLLAERFDLKIHWENPQAAVYFLQVASHGPKLEPATDTTHCGEVFIRDGVIRSDCMTTDDIAWALEQVFGQPVVNRTVLGSDRQYKVNLEFSSGDDAAGGSSIFSAVQEKLGLVLKAGKAPLKTLVIDSAQRPEPN